MIKKIAILTEFLLIHHIFKKSHDLNKVSKPGWEKLGFPLMYQTDVLEIMEILVNLGVRDQRMEAAKDLLVQKRRTDGKWYLENTFNGKMLVDIEKKGEPSKWLTLKATCVLSKWYD